MNFAQQLAQGISHQVDLLSLDDTMGTDGLVEADVEAVANDTVEEPEDVQESVQAIDETEEIVDNVADVGEEIVDASEAEVTLESISSSLDAAYRNGGMSQLSAHFARQTVSSVARKLKLPGDLASSVVPDMQSFDSPSDAAANTQVTMLGVKETLSGISDFIFTTTSTITQAINNWIVKSNRAVESLNKRSLKLRSKAKEVEGIGAQIKTSKQEGQNLSATEANIILAQNLFLGPQDNKVDGIASRMDILNKVMHDYLQGGVLALESTSEAIARTAGSIGGEVVDGALFNSIHTIASKVAKTQHNLPNGAVLHASPELFGGMAFSIIAEKPAKQYTTSDLVSYSRMFSVGMYPVNVLEKAKRNTWHQYVLKGLTSDQVLKFLDKIDSLVASMRLYTGSAQHQVAMGRKLIAEGKTTISKSGDKRAARSELRAAIVIWRASCTGAHDLIQHGLRVCNNVLEYIGKSISTLSYYYSGLLGGVARVGGHALLSAGKGVLRGGLVGGAIGAGLAAKTGDTLRNIALGGAYGGALGAGVGDSIGTAYGIGKGIYREGRRVAWDRAAKKHGV